MCTAAIMLPIAMGATAIGGTVSAYGAYKEGDATARMYRYMASSADMQAQIYQKTADQNVEIVKNTANLNKKLIQDSAAKDSQALVNQYSELIGAQTAAIGAQGAAGSVTAANIALDTLTKQKADELEVRYNADMKSWKLENESRNKIWEIKTDAANRIWGLGIEAGQYRTAAKNAKRAGSIGAMTSLLGSATQIGNTGLNYYLTK